jgi:membrane protease YdiL (CAAX protease family)
MDGNTRDRRYRWGWLIIGSIIFGVLMAVRGDLGSMWARAAVAGCAGAILALTIVRFRQKE